MDKSSNFTRGDEYEKMTDKLKTLKDFQDLPIEHEWGEGKHIDDCIACERNQTLEELKAEAIKDLINIYDLEKILNVKLNDKSINILNKYIMWKNNITEEDLK